MLAQLLDKSIPPLLKELSMKGIASSIVEIALTLYKNNKIGLKKAWNLSGLAFHKFLGLLESRGIDPSIPDELIDSMIETAKALTFEEMFP